MLGEYSPVYIVISSRAQQQPLLSPPSRNTIKFSHPLANNLPSLEATMSCNKVEDDAAAREAEAEMRNEDSEEAAASALTALGSSARKEEEDDDDDEMDFEIPQRFTKSGRKRAVPFSLKVSSVWLQP
jgi:hypothetical protein